MRSLPPVCRESVELRLGVPWMCLGVAGGRAEKRCKWLIIKPLEPASAAENPRVDGSIPPLATILCALKKVFLSATSRNERTSDLGQRGLSIIMWLVDVE